MPYAIISVDLSLPALNSSIVVEFDDNLSVEIFKKKSNKLNSDYSNNRLYIGVLTLKDRNRTGDESSAHRASPIE